MVNTGPGGEVRTDYQVLVDSDAFVGSMLKDDAHHKTMKALLEIIKQNYISLVTTSFVVAETATVLSKLDSQAQAKKFLHAVKYHPIIHITEELQAKSLALFAAQTKKRTSVVDCANVVVMKHFHIPRILSFDKAYTSQFDMDMMTLNSF
jgi:predicted nucleic acid-binding protein